MTDGKAGPASENQANGHPPALAWVARLVSLFDWSGRIVAASCLALMFVALFVNVVLRYSVGSGIAWAYEIHALLLPWLVAGGMVVAAARGRNIAITLLPGMLGQQGKRWLIIIINLVILLVCVSVLWSSQPILNASRFQTLSTLGVKQVWGYGSLIYSFGCMAMIAALDSLLVLGDADISKPDPSQTSLS